MLTAQKLWDGLRRVRTIRYVSQSNTPGWDGKGNGSVTVESPEESVLIFSESGVYQPTIGRQTRFNNVFRWTLTETLIHLEHLRFGPDRPVFLFNLEPGIDEQWVSVKPHLCKQDCYSAELRLLESGVRICWMVTGPKKNDRAEYTYEW